MNYKGHIIAGIIFLIALLSLDFFYLHFFFNTLDWSLFLYSPLILFSFLLPDIDHQSSKPKLLITVLLLAILLYYIFYQNYIYSLIFGGLLFIIWIMGFIPGWGHRGHAHSILFILLISFLVIFINYKIAILFLIGSFSHLLFDSCIKLW